MFEFKFERTAEALRSIVKGAVFRGRNAPIHTVWGQKTWTVKDNDPKVNTTCSSSRCCSSRRLTAVSHPPPCCLPAARPSHSPSHSPPPPTHLQLVPLLQLPPLDGRQPLPRQVGLLLLLLLRQTRALRLLPCDGVDVGGSILLRIARKGLAAGVGRGGRDKGSRGGCTQPFYRAAYATPCLLLGALFPRLLPLPLQGIVSVPVFPPSASTLLSLPCPFSPHLLPLLLPALVLPSPVAAASPVSCP